MALTEKVVETKDGFRVEGPNHEPIIVMFTPTFIGVEARPENEQVSDEELRALGGEVFGFYEYYRFSRHIGKCIAADWQRPEREGEEVEPRWLRPWKAKKEATFIGKEVHELWKKNLERIDPLVLAAHKQVFASCGMRCCDLVMDPELYQHPYIAKDIGQYRAAAIAAMNVDNLAESAAQNRNWSTPEARAIRQELEDLRKRALACNLDIRASVDLRDRYRDVESDLEAMANWRGLFSYNGEPYRSLNRTLMNLPGNIPHGFVCELPRWKLERPYTERLELLAILTLPERGIENHRVFEYARTPQIKEAMARVAEHTREDLSTRRYRDVKQVVNFLADYPERHTGNIVGLADKAITYHRAELEEERDREIARLGAETRAAQPPIPLPETPGVTFLDTVGAICQEGADMDHCAASYARRAVEGHHFLFHIEHDGDRATAQVGYQGGVVQIHGPRNRRNGAARWGRRVLRQWGRGFPEDAQRIPSPDAVNITPSWFEPGDEELPF